MRHCCVVGFGGCCALILLLRGKLFLHRRIGLAAIGNLLPGLVELEAFGRLLLRP
jgi:hypothetical protein